MSLHAIEWIDNAESSLCLLEARAANAREFLFSLAPEGKVADHVAKVVLVATLEVGDEVVNVHCVGLEGPSWREMEIADDLVDAHLPCNVASLFLLLLDLIRPALTHTL